MNDSEKTVIQPEKMAARDLFQSFVLIRDYQEGIKSGYSFDEKLAALKIILKPQIEQWGSIQEIDKWLETNDPGHSLISAIRGLDLTWLQKS